MTKAIDEKQRTEEIYKALVEDFRIMRSPKEKISQSFSFEHQIPTEEPKIQIHLPIIKGVGGQFKNSEEWNILK